MNSWRLDCRYFLGDRPCKFKRSCPGCKEYSPMGQRILIVKLAASGDVLRTTPLLSGLKRAHPQSHITWVVDKEVYPLLKNIPHAKILRKAKGAITDSGCENTLGQFAALVNLCDVVVTGDTTALHIAIALKKKVVAIFGPTCAQEIELYGRGEKMITSLPCAPCYRRSCEVAPNCMQAIKAEEVMAKIRALLPQSQRTRRA